MLAILKLDRINPVQVLFPDIPMADVYFFLQLNCESVFKLSMVLFKVIVIFEKSTSIVLLKLLADIVGFPRHDVGAKLRRRHVYVKFRLVLYASRVTRHVLQEKAAFHSVALTLFLLLLLTENVDLTLVLHCDPVASIHNVNGEELHLGSALRVQHRLEWAAPFHGDPGLRREFLVLRLILNFLNFLFFIRRFYRVVLLLHSFNDHALHLIFKPASAEEI